MPRVSVFTRPLPSGTTPYPSTRRPPSRPRPSVTPALSHGSAKSGPSQASRYPVPASGYGTNVATTHNEPGYDIEDYDLEGLDDFADFADHDNFDDWAKASGICGVCGKSFPVRYEYIMHRW